jgi:hypothetical protein
VFRSKPCSNDETQHWHSLEFRTDYSALPALHPSGASAKYALFKIAPGNFVEEGSHHTFM